MTDVDSDDIPPRGLRQLRLERIAPRPLPSPPKTNTSLSHRGIKTTAMA